MVVDLAFEGPLTGTWNCRVDIQINLLAEGLPVGLLPVPLQLQIAFLQGTGLNLELKEKW